MLAVVAAAAAGVEGLATSSAYRLHGTVVALRQLDLLYLDEPAPLADQLGIKAGSPTLLVICRSCRPPPVDVEVVVSAEPDVAAAYGTAVGLGGRLISTSSGKHLATVRRLSQSPSSCPRSGVLASLTNTTSPSSNTRVGVPNTP